MKYPITVSLGLSIVAAAIGTVGLYVLQRVVLPQFADTAFYRIVWGNAISPVIIFIFLVAVFLLLGKRRRIARERKLSHRFLSQVAPALFDDDTQIEDVVKRPSMFRENLLAQRWRLWQATRNTERARDLDQELTNTESEHLGNSYTAARFFVWSLPIVGFIGTVWGIGLSISFFSETMSSSQAGASVSALLQQNIPLVTQGLSTAFDTTLLALVLSVPATGLLVLVEQRERQYLLDTDASWRDFTAKREKTLPELNNLDIDLNEGDNVIHAQAVDESLRNLREIAFDRHEKRIQGGE
ncbi:MAG: MotA/TolQ/ExbB proton channel family protein [Gammaproteobacteria bacterium]|nr:MotA/TolQ/ExbB proton channel family protein [Gammaproteobacteria bacterium]